jgi:hypothetical protein
VLAAAPEALDEWAQLLVERSRREGIALTGEGGPLTDLMRQVLQTGLEVDERAPPVWAASAGQPELRDCAQRPRPDAPQSL